MWNSSESPNLRLTASGGECRPGRLTWPKWESSKCWITNWIDSRAFERRPSVVMLRHHVSALPSQISPRACEIVTSPEGVQNQLWGLVHKQFSQMFPVLFCLIGPLHPFQHMATFQRNMSWPSWVFLFIF